MKDKMIELIQLQECDNQLKKIFTEKSEGPLKIKELEKDFKTSSLLFHENKETLESLKKDRLGLEREIQDLESKARKSQEKLNNVKSNREYDAALKEIDDIEGLKTHIEDRVLMLMEEIEALEKKCIADEQLAAEQKRKFEKDKQEIEKSLDELERQSSALQKLREKYSNLVDPELLKKYNILREHRNGEGICAVIKGTCQVCHMEIPPQKFNELIKGVNLMTCPNCNRIMYWGEDEFYRDVINNHE